MAGMGNEGNGAIDATADCALPGPVAHCTLQCAQSAFLVRKH